MNHYESALRLLSVMLPEDVSNNSAAADTNEMDGAVLSSATSFGHFTRAGWLIAVHYLQKQNLILRMYFDCIRFEILSNFH